MRAIKMAARVDKDRKIMLEMPPDVPEGPAEVIVLVSGAPRENAHALLEAADRWRAKIPFRRTKEEIDRYLEEERASWEDQP